MNDPIRRLSAFIAMLFAALFVSTTIIQGVQARDLNARADNRRTLLSTYGRERGQILVDTEAIALSRASDDEFKFQRRFPDGSLYAHVTGYYSFIYGAGGGLESAENSLLSGQADSLFYRRVADTLTGKRPVGASLELTIDPRIQAAAEAALGSQRGAAVALDPRTGAILAMVSHPTYDPNLLSGHNMDAVQEAMTALQADETDPLVNRAIAGDLYPPGSVFKIVTSAAALSTGDYEAETRIPGPVELDLPQTDRTLPNYGGGACLTDEEGNTSLLEALQISCNTAFGWLGMELGTEEMADQAARFGIGDALSVPMRVTPSVFPTDLSPPQQAQVAIGQYDVRVTPLQVAMISAAVANRGIVMEPYLVEKVLGSDLTIVQEHRPSQLSEAVSSDTASQLTLMMRAVVDAGSGRPAAIPGVEVAGKTGTAEHGEGAAPHAWFTGFAPADDPRVAVAVVVEDGGNAGNEAVGGTVAGPVARAMMEEALNR